MTTIEKVVMLDINDEEKEELISSMTHKSLFLAVLTAIVQKYQDSADIRRSLLDLFNPL